MSADKTRKCHKCYLIEISRVYSPLDETKPDVVYYEAIGFTYNIMIVRWLYANLSTNVRVTEYKSIDDMYEDAEAIDASDARLFAHELDCSYDENGNMYPPVFEDDDVTIDTAYENYMVVYQWVISEFYDAVADFMKGGDLKDIFLEALNFMDELLYVEHTKYSFDSCDDDDFFDAVKIVARWLSSDNGKEEYYCGEY